MLPDLAVHPAAPEADAELLERLAAWCERYTPHVAIDRAHDHAAKDGSGALWLDITGCAHLFGGEAALRQDLLAQLERRGFHARAAIADSPGAAWALARYGTDDAAIVQPGGSRAALGALPVAALRLAPEQAVMLERLGLARIESLYPLPRQALAARFGEELTTRLDEALGAADEPISPRTPLPAHRAQLGFAEPILQTEALLPVTKKTAATALLRPRGGECRGKASGPGLLPGRQQHGERCDRHQPAVPRSAPARPAVRREAGSDRSGLRHRARDSRGPGGRAAAAGAARLARHGCGRSRPGARSGAAGRPPEQPARQPGGGPAGAARQPYPRARPVPGGALVACAGLAPRSEPRLPWPMRRPGRCAFWPGPSRSRP